MIDTHTHAVVGADPALVGAQLKQIDAERIVLSAVALDHWGAALNAECADLIDRFPEKLIGLVGIHPPDLEGSLEAIETYGARGFKGIKLMPTAGYYPDDERFRPIFDEVNRRGWLCLTHCGWCSKGVKEHDLPQATKYAEPGNFEALIRIYPEIDFIFAHGGGRIHYQTAWELSSYHDNVYVDTCPGQGPWSLRHAPEAWLNILRWDRLLFGTDTMLGEEGRVERFSQVGYDVKKILTDRGYASKWEDVSHNNASRLLDRLSKKQAARA